VEVTLHRREILNPEPGSRQHPNWKGWAKNLECILKDMIRKDMIRRGLSDLWCLTAALDEEDITPPR